MGVFVVAFVGMLWLPYLQCFSLLPRVLVILFALRPLLDAAQSKDAQRSALSLQNLFALVVALLLILLWRKNTFSGFLARLPNNILLVLIVLTATAWIIGGLSSGASAFMRTVWGLLVALLLGSIFKTEKQIDIFLRTLFYSSALVLFILLFNLKGEFIGDTWRISGQFGVANTLAAVSFSLFVLGLYTFENVGTMTAQTIVLSLLAGLAASILLAQSRTVGGLLLLSSFFWFWVNGHRKIVYFLLITIVAVVVESKIASEWRLTSSYSVEQRELSEDAINLTGRTMLWAKTLDQYASANALHKTVGLGWGTVLTNFESFGFELSSVTENSFLWFLVGSGVVGFVAFSGYLAFLMVRSCKGWRSGNNSFQRRLGLLAFLAVLTFVIEGFTTDLVLSPVSSGYLYAILSVFSFQTIKNTPREHAAQ